MVRVANIVDIAGADAFLAVAEDVSGGVGLPSRYGTRGCIPAVVKSTVGSFCGTREPPEMTACPLPAKKPRYFCLSSSAVIPWLLSDRFSRQGTGFHFFFRRLDDLGGKAASCSSRALAPSCPWPICSSPNDSHEPRLVTVRT